MKSSLKSSNLRVNPVRKNQIISTLRTCESIGEQAEIHYEFLQKTALDIRNDAAKNDLAQLFHGLGNQDRFLMLDLLHDQDRCVCELEAALNKSQPAISRDLKILEGLGILVGWKKGKFTHYSFNQERIQWLIKNFQEWINSISNILSKP